MGDGPTAAGLRPVAVAWLACLVPMVAANAAYLISATAEWVPWCLPYIEGCTSVSKAARFGAANHLLKAMMLPYATLLLLHWWLTAQWLRLQAPLALRRRRAVLLCGAVGAVFMVLYVTFLGVEGETYQWLRRYGINLYFAGTLLAQLLLTSVVIEDLRLPLLLRQLMRALCGVLVLLGLGSLPLQYLVEDRPALLNAIEWSFSLLMLLYFPLTAWAWQHSGFLLQARLSGRVDLD